MPGTRTSHLLTHCWVLIKDCAKFEDQYAALKKKGGKAAMAEEGDLIKRPKGKTNSKADEKRDASCTALQANLEGMMSQKEVRKERRSKGKDEQMKLYLELQTNRLDMSRPPRGGSLTLRRPLN